MQKRWKDRFILPRHLIQRSLDLQLPVTIEDGLNAEILSDKFLPPRAVNTREWRRLYITKVRIKAVDLI